MLIKKIAGNLFSLSIGNIISQFIVFYSFVYLATILEPSQFGLFSFAQAVINFFSRATEFGLETIAVRRISQSVRNEALFENIVVIRSVLSGAIATMFLVAAFISGFQNQFVVFAVLSLSMIGISFTVEWKYLAAERMSVVSVLRITRSLLFFIPLLYFTANDPSVLTASWLFSLSFMVLNGAIIFALLLTGRFHISHVSRNDITSLLKESAPIAAANVLMQVQYYYSTFILGILQDTTAVAVFSAAYRPLLAVWSFGVMAVYNAIFPMMNAASHDLKIFSEYVKRITHGLMTIGLIVFIIALPLSDTLMDLFYQGKYPESGKYFGMILVIILIVGMRTAVEYSLVSLRRQQPYLQGMILVGTLYLILCPVFTYLYHIEGVIYASITAEVIYTIYLVSMTSYYHSIKYFERQYIKSAVVVAVCYVVLAATATLSTEVQLMWYGISSLGTFVVLRFISMDDLRSASKIIS